MTLVELLVYMILLGIVLSIIASVIINTLQKQQEIVEISDANNTGQSVISSVDLAVANASGFWLRTAPSGSQLLVTKTRSTLEDATEVDVARCVGYFYDSTTKKLHTVSDMLAGSAIPRTYAADTTTFTGASSWPVLAEGVEPSGATTVFTRLTDASKISLGFSVASIRNRPPVSFATTTGIRGAGTIDNAGVCWHG